MSVENGKVCCNCRHNIRSKEDDGIVFCRCEKHHRYISYAEVMSGWCRNWTKGKEVRE